MSFSITNFLNWFETQIIEDQWLQFVGYMLAFGGLIGTALNSSKTQFHVALAVSFVGLGVSMAGWLYKKIYP
jgi:hypothetical protein